MTAPLAPFCHEALLYDGPEDFVRLTAPFVRAGVRAGEPVMVAVVGERIAALRDELGDEAAAVTFADMAEIGANPAHIIPAWRAFLERHGSSGPVRGIGEPVHAARDATETVECQLHESLLNVAFGDSDGFHLVCPYDTATLDPAVVHEARCSHAVVSDGGDRAPSLAFRGVEAGLDGLRTPLPLPPAGAAVLSFGAASLGEVREVVDAVARDAGLSSRERADLILAVHEAAANSVRHGGGLGVLRAWPEKGAVVAEIRDRGRIEDPLAGRHAPAPDQLGGWGLWIANQSSDLFQVRHEADHSVVRITVRRRA